ncbi:MAG: hypothetical protein ACRCTE_08570 [Cellulosilyticaceae bacterium]
MEPTMVQAEEVLEHLGSDPIALARYKAREASLHERANLISTGIRQGIEQGKIESARALLGVLDVETIASTLGLELELVKQISVEEVNTK